MNLLTIIYATIASRTWKNLSPEQKEHNARLMKRFGMGMIVLAVLILVVYIIT